jgi:hypothetical protein
MADDNGIELAVSNPCFELWLLLHFRENPGARHRHDLQTMMRKCIGSYDKHLDFRAFAAGYADAFDRAARMQQQAEGDGEPCRNPTTGVFRLTDSIARTDDDAGTAGGDADGPVRV